ncbi:MAG: hypothetical protein ACE37D_08675 [Pseudomonadales bacterium]
MNKFLGPGLAIITVCGLSFFAGYLLTRDTTIKVQPATSTIPGKIQTVPNPAVSQSGDAGSTPQLSFDGIATQVTIFDKLRYAHELANLADSAQLEAMLDQAAASRDPLYNYNMVSIFLEKYTAIDPLGAIAYVERSQLGNQQFITHIVTSWVRVDPEAAIDYFKNIQDPQLRNVLAGRLLSDPTLKGSGFDNEVMAVLGTQGKLLADIMSTQQLPPAMAFEEALQLEPRARQSAIHTALIRWLREDPEQVIDRVLQHPNLDERTRMFQGILNEYINIDEDAAFAFAQQHLTDNVRTEQHMLAMLGQRNPRRTLPLVEDFIARTGNVSPLNSMVSTWVQQEPQAALAYIDSLAANQRANLYQSVAYSYVNSHPEEGFRWLLTQRDDFPQIVRNTIAQSINHNTVNIAERTLSQITEAGLRTQLITGIGNYRASQDPGGALAWLEQYRGDAAYPTAVQNVIASMSHQNPRAAAAALEERLDDQYAAPLAGQIVNSWYRASPRDALNWARGLKEGEAKANALSNVVMMVAQQDPDEAMRIVRAIPSGQYQEDARRNVAYSLISENPQDVENIISELRINEADARHMREMARHRNQARGFGVYAN